MTLSPGMITPKLSLASQNPTSEVLTKSWHPVPSTNLLLLLCCCMLVRVSNQQPDCPNIPNTDGQPSTDGTSCNCISITYWDPVAESCVVDCSAILNSATVDQLVACTCNSGYTWTPAPILLCVGDCVNDRYSSGSININGEC